MVEPQLPRELVRAMELNPIKLLKRRARLDRTAREEADFLLRRFGENAYEAALQAAERPNLTSWGRQVMRAAADRLRPRDAAAVENEPPN